MKRSISARRMAALPAIAATAALLAACGGGATGGSGDSTGPIKVMTIASLESQTYSVPWLQTAVQAGVDSLNASGGIDGRQVEVSFCNDKFDPNEALACARRAVDEDAVAVLGVMTPNSGQIARVTESAGIPLIGPAGGDGKSESTMAGMYPINGGSGAFCVGAGALAVSRGGPKVVVVPQDNASSRQGAEWAAQGVSAAGGTPTTVVAPQAAPDYAATAASILSSGPDAVALTASGDDAVRLVSALRQAGFTGAISGPASIVNATSLQALGANAEGIILASRGLPSSDTENPLVAEYNQQMKAIDPNIRIDDIGLNGWLSVKVFADAMKGKPVTDGASVSAAFDSLSAPIDLQGVYPTYTGVANPPAAADFPRVAVFETMANTVQNGKVVFSGTFFNPLTEKG